MNPAITQESMKAIGILIAAFLTSIILASFFYLQPGSAQAAATDEECITHGIVEDVDPAHGRVRITIEASAGCPRNALYVYAMSEDGSGTVIDSATPDIHKDGTYTATIEFNVSKISHGYLVRIEDAFSASIVS